MILGGQDTICDNKAAKKVFDLVNVKDKDIITYDDVDHLLLHDGEYLPFITKDIISWLNTHY